MDESRNSTHLPSPCGLPSAHDAAQAMPPTATSNPLGHTGKLLHSSKGEHHTVCVYDEGDARYLSFSMHEKRVQTRLQRVAGEPVLDAWMGSLAAVVAAHPRAHHVLVLGLGGGALPMALRRIVPAAHIDAIDHDAVVLHAAQTFFGLTADDSLQLHVADARTFVQRSHEAGRRYDVIVLDVFDDDYIPARLMTVEFLREMHRILAPGGLLAANTFGPEPLRRREYATYAAVYGDFHVLAVDWNRILVAGDGARDAALSLQHGDLQGVQALAALGIDPKRLSAHVEQVLARDCTDALIHDVDAGCPALQAWRKRAVARPTPPAWSGIALALVEARARSGAMERVEEKFG